MNGSGLNIGGWNRWVCSCLAAIPLGFFFYEELWITLRLTDMYGRIKM